MSFQSIMLIIAGIFLVLTLIMFGIALYNKKFSDAYPPVKPECPDYWSFEKDGSEQTYCINNKNLGNSNCSKKINFNIGEYVGHQGECNKQKWAKRCNVEWDGITNNSNLCK